MTNEVVSYRRWIRETFPVKIRSAAIVEPRGRTYASVATSTSPRGGTNSPKESENSDSSGNSSVYKSSSSSSSCSSSSLASDSVSRPSAQKYVSHLLQMSLVVRKPVFGVFRPGPTQSGLYNHRIWLESGLESRGIVLSM